MSKIVMAEKIIPVKMSIYFKILSLEKMITITKQAIIIAI
jgi:hypothetical protein